MVWWQAYKIVNYNIDYQGRVNDPTLHKKLIRSKELQKRQIGKKNNGNF